MTLPDLEAIRAQFPGLDGPDALLDNAGGAQVPIDVADRFRDYLLHSYVQHGADYETSRRATAIAAEAHGFARTLVNTDGLGEVALGASSSEMCMRLADAVVRAGAGERDEIVVAEGGHEANMAPWRRLADRGFLVKEWKVDPVTGASSLDDLAALVGPRTRMVAMHHVSNLLGAIEDVAAAARIAHGAGARIIADGVAYAPHRAIDVAALGVDWYVFSTYKVYGPHMAVLFGTHDAHSEVVGPNFDFIADDDVPYKFELGGVNHEACAGLLGVRDYLSFLAGEAPDAFGRGTVEAAFARMDELEVPLKERFMGWLASRDDVRIIGPANAGPDRVSTMSFVHASRSSRDIAVAANEAHLGIRFGHFYGWRLALALGLSEDDGVVRTSLVHYNSTEEVDRLIEFLDDLLG